MIFIILIEPETPGNIGAVARIMANFDFKNLVIINPQCDIKSADAYKRAKHAGFILDNAIISNKNFLKKMDYLIGTTSKVGNDFNLNRSPMTPNELSENIRNKINSNLNIGLIFGREGSGLTNEELRMCDTVVSIPGSINYPTLNLSHAVAILLYNLFVNKESSHISHIKYATKDEIDYLKKHFNELLDLLEFKTERKKETQRFVFKRLLGRIFLKKREVFIIHGLLKKIIDKIKIEQMNQQKLK